MDYKWNKVINAGQKAIGYIDIYETNAKGIDIRAIVNFYPNIEQFGDNRICNTTILYSCSKSDITDAFFHFINDDIIKLIQGEETEKFDSTTKKFELMMTQQFFVKELPEMDYFTHGDYSAEG